MLYFGRFTWALRKARLPVSKNALVLDVGSGGKPYPRADVLLDRLTGDDHRCGNPMLIDGRPTVFGDALKMPFKDKSFDFVVASHILEHIENPEVFLAELQRVSKAGYIETPNALFERLFPYHIHCLEVIEIDGILHILKKREHVEDRFLGNLQFLEKDKKWNRLFRSSPSLFHVRHFWRDRIMFKVHNPDDSCEWIRGVNDNSEEGDTKSSYADGELSWRNIGLKFLAKQAAKARSKRLESFDLDSILACPECKGDLSRSEDAYFCASCVRHYTAAPQPDFTDTE